MGVKREDQFVSEVRRQSERARRSREMNFWQGLSLAGSVGWMVVVPSLLGSFLGRWLDEHFATGIFWTLSLLVTGLALGCLSAWRHVRDQLK